MTGVEAVTCGIGTEGGEGILGKPVWGKGRKPAVQNPRTPAGRADTALAGGRGGGELAAGGAGAVGTAGVG